MELSFTELDNLNNQNYNNQNYNNIDYNNLVETNNNYNRPSLSKIRTATPMLKNVEKPKRKQISYDDILSSMNTVVIDGKLEFIRKDKFDSIGENLNNNAHNNFQQSQYQQHYQPPQQEKKKVTFNQQPTPQIDKNSYIYNKFFKDYKDPFQVQNEAPKRPLTKQELLKEILINKINLHNERLRIEQIKSTKLLFNNNNNRNIIINSMQNPNGLNHLFKNKSK